MTLKLAPEPSQWLELAREKRADLLLVPKLDYAGDIARYSNGMFWANLPMFLLGGPFCYMIDDQTFEARVTLEVQLYELSWADESGSRAVTSLPLRADFDGTTLDFIDRADGNSGSYLTSLLIPAGFLNRRDDTVEEKVRQAALTVIVEELLDELSHSARQFESNERLAWLVVPQEQVIAQRLEDGRVRFHADVLPLYDGMDLGGTFRLSTGGLPALRAGDLNDPDAVGDQEAVSTYERAVEARGSSAGGVPLDFLLEGVPHGRAREATGLERERDKDPRPWFDGTLRLRVTDGRGGARSFTFGIAPVPTPRAARERG